MRKFNSDFNIHGFNSEKKQENTLILSQMPFYTLQGEGKYSGTPGFFVRTAFCSLHCSFCDEDSWDKYKQTWTFSELLKKLQEINSDCKQIYFSGGEPALQCTKEFVEFFHNEGYKINIETSGSFFNEGLKCLDYICISPKRLSDQITLKDLSKDKYIYNIDVLNLINKENNFKSELKFIIDSNTDESMLLCFIKQHKLDTKVKEGILTIWLSPCDEKDSDKNKKNIAKMLDIVLSNPNLLRMSLQVHKIVGLM